ncbi:MAG: Na/Pi cotransporter family protein [Clostridia bacterium]|nr:Na/Pi cotransporter family protein [Clostridia bacterium]
MDIFDILMLIGGLCLFLYGMNVMGQALERSAGSSLERMLAKLTSNKFAGLLTGLGVTAVIQSSSATTVMVVGFVNSGLMNLRQAIHVIMGANIGTTVTAWILSLGGISGDSIFLQLLKPTSFTPILALMGIILFMFCKSKRKKDIGVILLGFAVLMFGMDTMTGSVSGLKDDPAFTEMFIMFKNPILGVLVGAVLTAIIQSSSASVGILQALAATGAVSYGAAIPIIMGQNIGTCVTAIISSVGTNKNAKRAAYVHLSFNIIGTIVWLTAFSIVNAIFSPALFNEAATLSGIATAHSLFNLACTVLLFPMSRLLELLAYKLVPDAKTPEKVTVLDERLLATPAVALERCYELTREMAECSARSLEESIAHFRSQGDAALAASVREKENETDSYEDMIGSYLVKLSSNQMNEEEATMSSMLLKVIGDLERISDHAVNIVESREELLEKGISFSDSALSEINNMCDATLEIVNLSLCAFLNEDTSLALSVEPLEEVIDRLKETLRTQHIDRLRQGNCSIEAGFVWSDLITNMERVSDHCSNIAGCVIDLKERNLSIHESLKLIRGDGEEFEEKFREYAAKYMSFIG